MTDGKTLKNKALQLIIIFGVISLFGDVLYEGARSVNGPYLKVLGANAAIVGLISGIGEFMGYAIRLISGYFSDKTKAYWLFTFLGYALLISVPLLALAGIWQVAAFFIVVERFGKALRAPARDTIVSQATKQIGTGWGFGLNEAMDQIGAMSGPLILTVFFFFTGSKVKTVIDYQHGYHLFWIPFFILMLCILIAFIKVPNPEELETSVVKKPMPDKLSRLFWLYTAFSFVATAGFVNFVLIGYHFKTAHILSDAMIPLSYALAMGVDAIFALYIGTAYDRYKTKHGNDTAGLLTLIVIPALSVFIPILAFSNSAELAILSVIIWGVVMGAHETIMKSAIADLTPIKKRGTGYGIFNTSYGLAMLFGSTLIGVLYDISIPALIICCTLIELSAIPLFFMMRKEALKVL
jgi:MFS family permease